MAEQTSHEVIAGVVYDHGIEAGYEIAAGDITEQLDAAGFAIVRKPTGHVLEAALEAYEDELPGPEPSIGARLLAMAAALAAAAAVDGRTPDDRELNALPDEFELRARAFIPDSPGHDAWTCAARSLRLVLARRDGAAECEVANGD